MVLQKGILDESDPDTLTHIIFYMNETQFGIWGQERRNLVRWPNFQITLERVNARAV